MTTSFVLPPPEGPEYTPCLCTHIDPAHADTPERACTECDCTRYFALPVAFHRFTVRPVSIEEERATNGQLCTAPHHTTIMRTPSPMREPLDIDHHVPRPLSREEAAIHLAEHVPSDVVNLVWDEIIAPLYDSRRFASEWPRGRCRECNTKHPGHPLARSGPSATRHQMHCSKYTGPLTHQKTASHHTGLGIDAQCTCGQHYPAYDRLGHPNTCPDKDIDWRGPRNTPVTEG